MDLATWRSLLMFKTKGLRNVESSDKSKQVKTVCNMAFQKSWLEMEEDRIKGLKATWVQSICICKMEEA